MKAIYALSAALAVVAFAGTAQAKDVLPKRQSRASIWTALQRRPH